MSLPDVYGATPIKRKRRTKAELRDLRDLMFNLVREYQPMTVRQVFYQMVSRGHIAKTEANYKNTVGRLLTLMRKEGVMPLAGSQITPGGCANRKPTTRSKTCSEIKRRYIGVRFGAIRVVTLRSGLRKTRWPVCFSTSQARGTCR